MRRTATYKILLTTIAVVLALATGTYGTSRATLRVEASYSSEPVDVRVWLDRGYDDYYGDADIEDIGQYYDVYPSEDDVVLYVRAARSCYTTVYVIDTEGFIHVIHPLSPYDDAYLMGGRVYRLWLRDYGFHRGCFGRGVAFAFAVSSPVPFAYASYGLAVFGPHVGFQIYGDPFIAARLFYLSLLPRACNGGFVSVSYARFYVREYVRYPGYLCLGWNDCDGGQSYAGGVYGARRQYRVHAKDPYRVLLPAGDADRESARYTRIMRTGGKDASDARVSRTANPRIPGRVSEGAVERVSVRDRVSDNMIERAHPAVRAKDPVAGERVRGAGEATDVNRVVRSTKDTYMTSKRNYEKMREVYERSGDRESYEKSGDRGRIQVRPVREKLPTGVNNTKATTVSRRAVKEARQTVALGGAAPRERSNSGKITKRTK